MLGTVAVAVRDSGELDPLIPHPLEILALLVGGLFAVAAVATAVVIALRASAPPRSSTPPAPPSDVRPQGERPASGPTHA